MSREAEAGSKRASELSEAMLGVPGYADDSMFFVVRYGDKAKVSIVACLFHTHLHPCQFLLFVSSSSSSDISPPTHCDPRFSGGIAFHKRSGRGERPTDSLQNSLRKCEWDDLQDTIGKMASLWSEPGAGDAVAPEQRSSEAAELREHALAVIKHFPDLVRDFDRFVTAYRSTMSAVGRPG
ncbi:hypothetical protein DCS_03541 [Drechmeria coniospora]|uniref:Uncharacterized protein n=1 Tax=Drechmeria coniospora TaxID=98403 RepID=A0A151GHM2_DRECN|nr:hypothetical protein DCS_03541 [Drechmeria coniospora]KYK56541.1 hypothetical protein DCS_03541 [Drechmeria coniospora]